MAGAFDTRDPPDQAVIDDCTHCGFCLPACPTYLLWGEEMDSPRGRISLMEAGLEGEPLTPTMVRHMDACLGCMACVTACPSGVRYDRLIGSTRSQVERRHRRGIGDRLFRWLVFRLFPYPARLRRLLGPLRIYERARPVLGRAPLPERLRVMESLLPAVPRATPDLPRRTAAEGTRRLSVGLLTGCVQRVFFGEVNAATVRVLAAEGCDVVVPGPQGCCGALSVHAGREDEARSFAGGVIDAFAAAGVDAVAVNAAGCGSTMKEYGRLLRDDPRAGAAERFAAKVRDISEVLAELWPVAVRHPLPIRAVYQDACHLAHAQGIRSQPRQVLGSVPALELLEITEAEICCGSGGIYNLLQPGAAAELGERKARHILALRPELVITANPGCALQLRASFERLGATIPIVHSVQVVDASIRGCSPSMLLDRDRRTAVTRRSGARRSSSPSEL